jgi:hypothetical protein
MEDTSVVLVLLILLVGGIIWLIPLLAIIASRRTSGSEKLAWVLAVLFVSWFAWIFYLLLAPIKKN